MSTNVMKALRFSEFGPPSVLRIEDVAIPRAGRGGSTRSSEGCSDQSKRHRERRGTLQEYNSAANPWQGLCGRCCKRERGKEKRSGAVLPKLGIVRDGSHAEYVVVPAETLSLKPKSLSMAQAAAIGVPYITAWASRSERSSNPAWRNHSNCRRRGRGGTSSHTDCQLEAGARYWRGYRIRSDSRHRVGSQYRDRRSS